MAEIDLTPITQEELSDRSLAIERMLGMSPEQRQEYFGEALGRFYKPWEDIQGVTDQIDPFYGMGVDTWGELYDRYISEGMTEDQAAAAVELDVANIGWNSEQNELAYYQSKPDNLFEQATTWLDDQGLEGAAAAIPLAVAMLIPGVREAVISGASSAGGTVASTAGKLWDLAKTGAKVVGGKIVDAAGAVVEGLGEIGDAIGGVIGAKSEEDGGTGLLGSLLPYIISGGTALYGQSQLIDAMQSGTESAMDTYW